MLCQSMSQLNISSLVLGVGLKRSCIFVLHDSLSRAGCARLSSMPSAAGLPVFGLRGLGLRLGFRV